jgi:predicted nucleic acid-binding protein
MEITITQHVEEEGDADSEIDEYQDMTRFLQRVQKSPVRKARKDAKMALKQYNTLRDKLRHEKKKCIKKALVQFRETFRKEFRGAQLALRSSIKKEWEEEKKVCIDLLGESNYKQKPWFELHKLLSTGIQFKDDTMGRKNDPWNSSFWYA